MTVTMDLDRGAIRRAAERHGVAELAVFGSAVTDGFTAGSDVDFLVDFLPHREDPFEDYSALRKELEGIVERKVDLVVKRAIRNPYFRAGALAQAETLYVADVYGSSMGRPSGVPGDSVIRHGNRCR
jgi:predicted nucleotidyltransferase